ncbi:MAG: hypothetical protein FD180_3086 [Planctomycetota bacterium]|nr:MAG: hypothetical protein FD180_3086 [Planctomycetota bacterium]
MTAEEEFLAARIADPMLRSRDIIEALSLAVAAEAKGALESVAALLVDARRPPALRRIAAAAFYRLAGRDAGRARFEAAWSIASGEDRTVLGLAIGWWGDALDGLERASSDHDASGWLAVAHTLQLKEALPGIERTLRDPSRHADVRRQAAEVFRALTTGDAAARERLRAHFPPDGSMLDELIEVATSPP